jgi:hypothetical protein
MLLVNLVTSSFYLNFNQNARRRSVSPPCISIKPLDCGVGARTWKACMRMCVFYTRVFLQCAFFPPAHPPTGSFFTLCFFTQCTFFLPPLHANVHESLLQSVFFLRPSANLHLFYTWVFTQYEYKLTTK